MNPVGGAVALGHPIRPLVRYSPSRPCTSWSAVMSLPPRDALHRRVMGIAAVFERVGYGSPRWIVDLARVRAAGVSALSPRDGFRGLDRWSCMSVSRVMGRSRIRLPVAWKTALATAAGGAGVPDLAQADQPQWHRLVQLVEPRDVDRRDVGLDGHVVGVETRAHRAPVAGVDKSLFCTGLCRCPSRCRRATGSRQSWGW